MRLCLLAALIIALATPLLADSNAGVSGDSLVLSNDLVRQTLIRSDGVWRTVSYARADGSDALIIESDEFLVRLMDGTELTVADYRAEGEPIISNSERRTCVRIFYVPRAGLPEGSPRSVTVAYLLGDEPYLRKTMTLAMGEGQAVDSLQVERFRTTLDCDRGGRGEPVFIGDAWFAGLEYPGSQTAHADGLVTLTHFPGLAKQDAGTDNWFVRSKTAVVGTGSPGDPPELIFSDYVDTIRLPSRNFMQYNSWYDWRGDQINVENLVKTFEGFKDNLLDPYGLTMDAFVPDDGWQDRNSIWMPKAHVYPDGFAPLRDALEARGTRMGIWMPLNGTNLNTNWGVERGYEKSNRGRYYCLVGPKYNAAIRAATKRIITQGNLSYYKHDFNGLRCTAEGHGHLPDDRHGHEANLDAEIELLAYEHALQPGIFLNVTSNVWLSPWWLMHADSIWMCAGDFGYNKAYPQLSPREWAMSYRDAHFHSVYTQRRNLVPVSAMMTHGIIHGKLCKLGGSEETLREWSDYVVMYYGRGVQLKELYVTPELLDEDWWKVLGEATRWAIDNTKLLENVVMVGGSPRQGEAYGYVHWSGDRGIICLRNPAPFTQEIQVPFDKSVRYRGADGRSFRARVIYPYVEALPTRCIAGEATGFELPPCSVMLYELTPGVAPKIKAARRLVGISATGKAVMGRDGISSVEATLNLPQMQMPRCDLYLIITGTAKGVDFREVKVNGESAKPRRSDGEGWILHSIDLRDYAGATVKLEASLPGGGDQPFSSPDVVISGYVVADLPVPAAEPRAEHLPFAISQGFRRYGSVVVPETRLERRQTQEKITADQLKSIKAAKLRIRVFDVNSDEQYRDKFIVLNGEKLARVPGNKGTLAAWQETVIDLKPEQLKWVKLRNTLELGNAGGDCYKFTGLTLSVQLADGKWVESSADWTVHSSVSSWLYTEGKVFRGGTSGPITLRFD